MQGFLLPPLPNYVASQQTAVGSETAAEVMLQQHPFFANCPEIKDNPAAGSADATRRAGPIYVVFHFYYSRRKRRLLASPAVVFVPRVPPRRPAVGWRPAAPNFCTISRPLRQLKKVFIASFYVRSIPGRRKKFREISNTRTLCTLAGRSANDLGLTVASSSSSLILRIVRLFL